MHYRTAEQQMLATASLHPGMTPNVLTTIVPGQAPNPLSAGQNSALAREPGILWRPAGFRMLGDAGAREFRPVFRGRCGI
jgi:hypothetical protein